jgi:hypothetical protein
MEGLENKLGVKKTNKNKTLGQWHQGRDLKVFAFRLEQRYGNGLEKTQGLKKEKPQANGTELGPFLHFKPWFFSLSHTDGLTGGYGFPIPQFPPFLLVLYIVFEKRKGFLKQNDLLAWSF